MARYKLMSKDSGSSSEWFEGGQRKATKKQIEQWIQDNIKACGLDWRVGYTVKFRDSQHVYNWVWIKDGSDVKV